MCILRDTWGTACKPKTCDRITVSLRDPREGGAILLLVLVKVLCHALWHRLLLPLSKLLGFATQENPVGLINSPQQENATLEAAPGEPNKLAFSCAICLEEHSIEDCYIASACGHRMCRNAARQVVLGAVRYASGLATSARCLSRRPASWTTCCRPLPWAWAAAQAAKSLRPLQCRFF